MRLSQLIGQRIKDAPKDAQSPSHIFLLRGGYARPLSAGLYTILPLGKRVLEKVEAIIREEMARADSQEMLMPLVNPAELWAESGRLEKVDQTLVRFKDRNAKDMVLAMTHEEAVCAMARTEITSYKQLPACVYQIQTKYRDEARPRAGLIRVREFTMKDAYSFHSSYECLEAYYERQHEAYTRIFKRLGMKEVLSIQSDSGMIGGKVSHEFMAVSETGEDTIIVSPCRSYRANREIATAAWKLNQAPMQSLETILTPQAKTIEEVASFLGTQLSDSCKCVLFESADLKGKIVMVLIRGDIEVNEVKLKNHLKTTSLYPAFEENLRAAGITPGYASPLGVDMTKVRLVVDPTVADSHNLIAGANAENTHYKGYCHRRDAADRLGEIIDVATAKAGDPCPVTGAPLIELRGIEVGNIFQLGTRYSEAMGVKFLDQHGKAQTAIMGCYGIGVGRAMASVIEQSHDKYGPIWPITIAPWQIHLIGLANGQEEISKEAEQLYTELKKRGAEVLFDDRDPKAGFAFADADLIGIPIRAILSAKSIEKGGLEFKLRDGSNSGIIPLQNAVDALLAMVQSEYKQYTLD